MTPDRPDTPLETARLIGVKRDGGHLSASEISALITAYLDGAVSDAQMAALLMAGVIRGFTTDEAVALTEALLASGGVNDLTGLTGPTVDKHSTGGVGDTTTLVVAPLLAAVGCQVPKLSGRGLGHTGGTLDKLEAIPGLSTELGADELRAQVARIGLAVAAAGDELTPADKRLYALRDVTGTVGAPALIASSVMSKKLAAGADHIVLDVKAGSGALADADQAARLARLCVAIGEAHDRRIAALVTGMSQPLGTAVGNALEVAAAVEVLRGERSGDLAELSVALAATGLELATGLTGETALQRVRDALDSGAALERFAAMVTSQGGDARLTEDPWSVLPRAPVVHSWGPDDPGRLHAVDTRRLGELAVRLGAGRLHPDDVVDPAVGLEVPARVGAWVEGTAVVIHARRTRDAEAVAAELAGVFTFGASTVGAERLVLERIPG